MTRVHLIRSARLTHADYADAAVIAPGSELVLFAGVCPLDENGATVAPGDVGVQMRHALENLGVALDECGLALADVANVRISVATRRREDLREAWVVFRECLGERDVPATLVGVTVLGYDEQLVEVEAIAARAGARASLAP